MVCKCVFCVCQHVAAATGSVQVVKALLKAGAKNSKNKCVGWGLLVFGWPAVVALTSRTGLLPCFCACGEQDWQDTAGCRRRRWCQEAA